VVVVGDEEKSGTETETENPRECSKAKEERREERIWIAFSGRLSIVDGSCYLCDEGKEEGD
jgi:hypothetical protein